MGSTIRPGDPVIAARELGVRYSLRLTRKNTVRQTFTNLLRRGDGPRDFWALRDVSFDLGSGEMAFVVSIALIGSAVGAWFAGQLADSPFDEATIEPLLNDTLKKLEADAVRGLQDHETGGGRQGVLAVHAVVYESVGCVHSSSMRQRRDLASPGHNYKWAGHIHTGVSKSAGSRSGCAYSMRLWSGVRGSFLCTAPRDFSARL